MTPEERLTRIENIIQALVETQARHDLQLEKQSAQLEKQSAQLEKQSAGIRDLIVVSRTLIDSQQGLVDSQRLLAEAQRATDSQLQALIQTVARLSAGVDALLKGFPKPNGNL